MGGADPPLPWAPPEESGLWGSPSSQLHSGLSPSLHCGSRSFFTLPTPSVRPSELGGCGNHI